MQAPLTYRCPSCDHDAVVGKPCATCNANRKPRNTKLGAASKKKKHQHSWQQDSIYDGLDLPEDPDVRDADAFNQHQKRIAWYWIATAVLLIIATLASILK